MDSHAAANALKAHTLLAGLSDTLDEILILVKSEAVEEHPAYLSLLNTTNGELMTLTASLEAIYPQLAPPAAPDELFGPAYLEALEREVQGYADTYESWKSASTTSQATAARVLTLLDDMRKKVGPALEAAGSVLVLGIQPEATIAGGLQRVVERIHWQHPSLKV